MNQNNRPMLVTNALPYSNGPLHLGHLVEHIQTNIWIRVQKLLGNQCIVVCGEDAHGTPIMIKAEQMGLTPEELIAQIKQSHEQDFQDFYINYDSYYTTHSKENQELAGYIYRQLKARGDIVSRTISQLYDPIKNMFLPDRYVKGICPSCQTPDQYGDNCEVCGATYNPTDLKEAKSILSGVAPIEKESEHFFFKLPNYTNLLKQWTTQGHLQPEVANKMQEWFTEGLKDWDISRDAPYFGFEIPDAPGKYFYVWLDAPIGYMASFKKYCEQHPEINFDDYWGKDSTADLYHFVGKDIIYFHALFWPAMLAGSNFRTPTAIFTHGYLTINGQKMSKSRGTFITARQYLEHLDAQSLRYYFAAKLSNRVDDIDLNFEDFRQRVNSDLVGKVVNIASRCAGFITKNFAHTLSLEVDAPQLIDEFLSAGDEIANLYLTREYSRAIKQIMTLADRANQYIDEQKPWQMIKGAATAEQVQLVCTTGLNLFRILIVYLKPVLPQLAYDVEQFLNIPDQQWQDRQQLLINHKIKQFTPLMQRIEPANILNLLESSAKVA